MISETSPATSTASPCAPQLGTGSSRLGAWPLPSPKLTAFEIPPAFQNFVFMGDFNAGCSYVPKKHWKNIRLRTYSEFAWLIGDKNDTTVKNSTSCPYDR